MIENVEVVVAKLISVKNTGKDVADEFHQRGLSDTSLSEKEDGVGPIRPVL